MSVRTPARAGSFYPSDAAECRRMVEECLAAARMMSDPGGEVLGGIFPHAGWVYSGATAASLVNALKPRAPETFVIFGAVHSFGVGGAALQSAGAWRTPLGEVPIDETLAAKLLEGCGGLVLDDERAHAGEHSIEVQLPFLQVAFESPKIVPVAMPAEADPVAVGRAVGKVLAGEDPSAAVLGSTDLTHYGPSFYGWAPKGTGEAAHTWVTDDNDRRIIDLMLAMKAEDIVAEARSSRNACGAGAVAATISACRAMGATRATLLDQTTSYLAGGERGEATDFVGYAAVSFEK